MNNLAFRSFLGSLPKTETHLHIEGALPWELLEKKDPKMFSRIIALTIVMLYAPKFTNFYIQKYSQINLQYQQGEICCLLLLIVCLLLQSFSLHLNLPI